MGNKKEKMLTLDRLRTFNDELLRQAVEKFAEKVVVETLRQILRTDNAEGLLLSITDAESNIVSFVDKQGRFHFCLGASTDGDLDVKGDARVDGRVLLKNCTVKHGTTSGMFYILDGADHILFEIDARGKTNFNGIPTDIQKALNTITARLEALESANGLNVSDSGNGPDDIM